jgi:hypothetical protein
MFYLEVIGIVIVVNVACLPWAWLAWDLERERTEPCKLKLTEHADYAVHAAQTQVLTTSPMPKAKSATCWLIGMIRSKGRFALWAGGRAIQS